ncbi:MAG: hypothetical protein AVDCRST_MAG68-3272, partial [uncultured Gemmatimonadetes bacterium]
ERLADRLPPGAALPARTPDRRGGAGIWQALAAGPDPRQPAAADVRGRTGGPHEEHLPAGPHPWRQPEALVPREVRQRTVPALLPLSAAGAHPHLCVGQRRALPADLRQLDGRLRHLRPHAGRGQPTGRRGRPPEGMHHPRHRAPPQAHLRSDV